MKWPRTSPPQGDPADLPPGSHGMQNNEAVEPPRAGPKLEDAEAISNRRAFPCENCGAALRFAPGQESLVCDYCKHEQKVPTDDRRLVSHSLAEFAEKGDVALEVLEGSVGEARCTGCGAVVEVSASLKTMACPFCGTHLQNAIQAAKPMLRPDGVFPFGITREQAKAAFHTWVNSRWFAPKTLKKIDRADSLHGIYLPYWAYDANTMTSYAGMRGTHYYVTVGSGRNRRTQRRTSWRPVSGVVYNMFRDVMVPASNSLPPKLLDKCGPWNPREARAWQPAFLSGFEAERYQVTTAQGFEEAKNRMEPEIRKTIVRDIGGDAQRITSMHPIHNDAAFKLLLAPVWIVSYRLKDKAYRVVVNGRSGTLTGERPYDALKITLATIAGIVVLAFLLHFLSTVFFG